MVKIVRKAWYITRKRIQREGDENKKRQKKERKVDEIQQKQERTLNY